MQKFVAKVICLFSLSGIANFAALALLVKTLVSISQVSMDKQAKNYQAGKRIELGNNGGSDSNNSSDVIQVCEVDSSGTTSSKFKGVVLQRNGTWGAQIYNNHNRFWLGTFKSEIEAATAYDSASIKFHGGTTSDSHNRNIPCTNVTVHEPNFQTLFTTESVTSMIKDGSYSAKLHEYVRNQTQQQHLEGESHDHLLKKLFNKQLTASDVSKLNRLVIPKKFALMHFCASNIKNVPVEKDMVLYDRSNVKWRFRFCYWKSSQSYVFTRGWNDFVRTNGLKVNDVVTFFSCEECKRGYHCHHPHRPSFVIGVEYYNNGGFQDDLPGVKMEIDDGNCNNGGFQSGDQLLDVNIERDLVQVLEKEDAPELGTLQNRGSNGCSTSKGFRLFGVQIL